MPTLESTRHLLAGFDGAATEIWVIGLPLSQLPVVMATLADLPALEVTGAGDRALEHSESFNAKWRSRIESVRSDACMYWLLSASGTAQHLQIIVWVDPKTPELEVEFVFWNNLTFPPSLQTWEREQRLEALISLAEACRAGVPGARCILAAEHNGPIEEVLENDDEFKVVW